MTIAPIISHGAGYAPYYWLTKKTWYTELPATFVIWDTSQPESASGMSNDRIVNTFGVPQEKFSVGRYEVFSYDHALNDRLQGVRN